MSYLGSYSWFPCEPKEVCDSEGHYCLGTHSTIGHAAATSTKAMSHEIPLTVVVLPSQSPSEIDAYSWHW